MYEPYVSERTTFAIRYHQALRFFPDEKAGYKYPELYYTFFGMDYVPPPHRAGRLQLRAQAQVVRRLARRDGERSLRLRQGREGQHRSLHRHPRPALQAAEGRPGQRQHAGGAYVAHAGESGRAALQTQGATTMRATTSDVSGRLRVRTHRLQRRHCCERRHCSLARIRDHRHAADQRAASMAISPDGRELAFVAQSEGRNRLWVQDITTGATRVFANTSEVRWPFWSPDGQDIGFFNNNQIWRVDVEAARRG